MSTATTTSTLTANCECGWRGQVSIPADCDPRDPQDRYEVRIAAIQRHRVQQGGPGTGRCRAASR